MKRDKIHTCYKRMNPKHMMLSERSQTQKATWHMILPGQDVPEKAMAALSSVLAWRIPGTEEPRGLQSMGSQRVGHNWATSLSIFTSMHWRWKWQPTPVLLPGESQGQRSLVGCRLWGCTESDTTEQLHFHFSLSCTEDGSGNPLQCSCLENPRDGGAWWIAIDGVTQSRTRLKWLSSSSKDVQMHLIFCVLNPKLNSTMRNSYRAMTSYMPLTGSESTYRLRREDKRYSK